MKTTNLISVDFTEEQFEQAIAKVDELGSLLPFLLSLTAEQRQGGIRLGDKSVGFLEKSKDYSVQSPQFTPTYADMPEMYRDASACAKLLAIARKMRPLLDKIEDTATIAGMEAFSAALVYYHSVKAAAKQGAPGAQAIYDDLKKRFPGGPGTDKTGTEPTK